MWSLGLGHGFVNVWDCVAILRLEHSYSESSNLIDQFEVSYFHSDTDEGTTCSALALRTWLFCM